MNHNLHIMAREDYILPSMLPLDYTHRASYNDENDSLVWRWFSSEEAARKWLAYFECIEMSEEDFEAERAAHEARKEYRARTEPVSEKTRAACDAFSKSLQDRIDKRQF